MKEFAGKSTAFGSVNDEIFQTSMQATTENNKMKIGGMTFVNDQSNTSFDPFIMTR